MLEDGFRDLLQGMFTREKKVHLHCAFVCVGSAKILAQAFEGQAKASASITLNFARYSLLCVEKGC
jgi:hypothetical protein